MKLKGLTEADVDAMVNKVDQGADADAPSPVKRNARETAALFAGVLKEESRRTQAQADPAGEAAREARTVWTATRIARREELPVEEGWKGRIAKAINGKFHLNYDSDFFGLELTRLCFDRRECPYRAQRVPSANPSVFASVWTRLH